MPNININYQQLVSSLLGIVLAMTGFWLIYAKDLPTRDEVSSMIQKESPYNSDKQIILKSLGDSATNNKALSDLLASTNSAVIELRVETAKLRQQITDLERRSNGK